MSGFFVVDPELYRRYRDQVLELSNSVQVNVQEHLPREHRRRGLSDREIAERLGLEEHLVREIRVVAERDRYGIDEWQKAIEFKDRACRAYAKEGASYAFAGRRKR
jgi:ribosome-binding protein aMBF1 (putative translation factor)